VRKLVCALFILAVVTPVGSAAASNTQWSIFEDAAHLVTTSPQGRAATLGEIRRLGADTIRVQLSWSSVAPRPRSKKRPRFNAKDPAAYPGFATYDDLVRQATADGFRLLVTITGDAPVWATARKRGHNYKPSPAEFGSFVAAVGRRYSGNYSGLPRVSFWSVWNEPNLPRFLRPQSAARVYRGLASAAIRSLRSTSPGSKVFVGELEPVATRVGPGPLAFIRSWLCLNKSYRPLRGRAARRAGCRHVRKTTPDGFAIHAYTRPISRYRPKGDAVTLYVIRRLARALDLAARAHRIPRKLPIYNTEFGIQTNPPDPFQGGSLGRQAQIINESEEFSYRYSRLKSFAQYLLYDDARRPGPAFVRWSGFQSGLRFASGKQKPAYEAYRFPIVVHKRGGRVSIWGRARAGTGARLVQLQRKRGGRFVNVGSRIQTNPLGYFSVKRPFGSYRFLAYGSASGSTGSGAAVAFLGKSRTAKPTR
jgi:hypothetical protein